VRRRPEPRAVVVAASVRDSAAAQVAKTSPSHINAESPVESFRVHSAAAAATAAAAAVLLAASPALALDIRIEPANALSLPTWAVHTSSVLEWMVAMGLM
jgi:hypothetical protein